MKKISSILFALFIMFGLYIGVSNKALAYSEQDVVNLITGNDNSSWIAMDSNTSCRTLTFRSDETYKVVVRKFNPKGFSDILYCPKNDGAMVFHIQYNADQDKYYAYIWLGANQNEMLCRSGYYRD